MRPILVVLSLIFILSEGRAQWLWDYGATLGASNYLGDIGGKEKTRQNFVSDIKLTQTRWNVGGFVRYRAAGNLSYKLAVDYIRLEGDDKLSSNPGRNYRNFNFKNDIIDLSCTLNYFFYDNNDLGNTYRFRNGMRAYGFIGAGVFYTNPKTYYRDAWVATQPYQTEGYKYKKIVMNIPMGAGFYLTFNKRNRFGFELSYRKTFTDYIDDISGNYPATPPATAYERGLVLRSTQLSRAANPAVYDSHTWGNKRGDPAHKDSYMTINLSYGRVIRGKPSFYRSKGLGLFGPRRGGRKIRSRF
jgi:hypothetical protein